MTNSELKLLQIGQLVVHKPAGVGKAFEAVVGSNQNGFLVLKVKGGIGAGGYEINYDISSAPEIRELVLPG